jgi:hypothetical protein
MCTQLDVQVISKRSKKYKKYHLIFMNFGVENFFVKKM